MTDVLSDRTLPHSLDAERSVLGSVLLHEDVLHLVVDALRDTDFFRDAHRRIFRAMLALSEAARAIDMTTLREELSRRAELDEVGGPAYLSSLVDGLPRSANVAHYAAIVSEKSRLRQAISAASKVVGRAYEAGDDVSEILSEATEALFSIGSQASRGRPVSVRELVPAGMARLEASAQAGGAGTAAVATGFSELDEMTAGLQPGNMIVLAARPSVGKSAFAMNIAQHAAKAGKRTLFFSLEMSKDELFVRLLSATARVDSHRMRGGFLGERDWGQLSEAIGAIAELPLFIDDTASVGVLEVRARARMLRADGGLDLILIDYVQLMRGRGKFENRTQEIGTISRALKAVAKELQVPVVVLSQLNRSMEAKGRRPQLSDLRESGDLEQDADVVLFLWRPDMKAGSDEADQGIAEVIVGKQRNGPTGVVRLAFVAPYTRFENLAAS